MNKQRLKRMKKSELRQLIREEVKKVLKETGEMSKADIKPGGEYFEWAENIKKAAKKISNMTKGRLKFIDVRPFDTYQGHMLMPG